MKPLTVTQRVLSLSMAIAMLGLSVGMAAAVAYDFTERDSVTSGVTVNSTSLGGMSKSEARSAIEQRVADPLSRPILVTAADDEFTFDPQDKVDIDIDAMLDQAYQPRRDAAFVERLRHDLLGGELSGEVTPVYTIDSDAVSRWVSTVASEVNTAALDATRVVDVNMLDIQPSIPGRKVRKKEAQQAIAAAFEAKTALEQSERIVPLPVKTIKPKVTEDELGKTIIVDLSQRKVRLFDGEELEKAYPCAIGTPQFPTPQGEFEITLKRYMPSWYNPGSGWAKSMPRVIPPGPSNPLGTRALNISASGIRFHGTSDLGSIGTAASHGCMRMLRHDIEDLYERVEVGTKVYIVP